MCRGTERLRRAKDTLTRGCSPNYVYTAYLYINPQERLINTSPPLFPLDFPQAYTYDYQQIDHSPP